MLENLFPMREPNGDSSADTKNGKHFQIFQPRLLVPKILSELQRGPKLESHYFRHKISSVTAFLIFVFHGIHVILPSIDNIAP